MFKIWKIKNLMTIISKLKKKFSVNENFFRGKGEENDFQKFVT